MHNRDFQSTDQRKLENVAQVLIDWKRTKTRQEIWDWTRTKTTDLRLDKIQEKRWTLCLPCFSFSPSRLPQDCSVISANHRWLKWDKYKLDQVHLACRTQLWNLRNSGKAKILWCITSGASPLVHLLWCITDSPAFIIFDTLESYYFQKYSTCWVF